jgi:hypothetical protein
MSSEAFLKKLKAQIRQNGVICEIEGIVSFLAPAATLICPKIFVDAFADKNAPEFIAISSKDEKLYFFSEEQFSKLKKGGDEY